MDELMRLIAAEALYQISAAVALRGRVLLSREQFCKQVHLVQLDTDQMLDLFKYQIVPVPDSGHIAQHGGLAARVNGVKGLG
jgi:hypothetical protein